MQLLLGILVKQSRPAWTLQLLLLGAPSKAEWSTYTLQLLLGVPLKAEY